MIAESFKRFPPGNGVLRVPTSSRTNALAGLAMYAPCRPTAVLAQRLAWLTVKVWGAGALPGRAQPWDCPMEPAIWSALAAAWRREIGAFETFAMYERRAGTRPGLAILLMQDGQAVGFVKVRRSQAEVLSREAEALTMAWDSRPKAFAVPQPLALGQFEGWHYLLMTALQPRLHRMPLSGHFTDLIIDDVQTALTSLTRPPETPAHWMPMHGDLSVWNLREPVLRATRPFLVDWEYAGWAPPGADETWYRATRAAVTGSRPARSKNGEAITFWEGWVRSWTSAGARELREVSLLLTALGAMREKTVDGAR